MEVFMGYEPVTATEFVGLTRDVLDGYPSAGEAVEKALAKAGAMDRTLSPAEFEFTMQLSLREHWRAMHGNTDAWDEIARAGGIDLTKFDEAVA